MITPKVNLISISLTGALKPFILSHRPTHIVHRQYLKFVNGIIKSL